MLPCIFYIVMLILLLYYPAHLLEWLYLSKKKPAVYSRTTDFLYYSFYLLRCVSDKFSIFKHNLFYFLICLKSFVTNKAFKRFSILWMSVWWCLFCVSISQRNNCYWFKVTWNIKLISDNLRKTIDDCPLGIRPLSYLHRLPLRWTAPPKVSRQLLILYFFTQILFPSFIFYLLFDSINAIMYIE